MKVSMSPFGGFVCCLCFEAAAEGEAARAGHSYGCLWWGKKCITLHFLFILWEVRGWCVSKLCISRNA